jgi:hypothetical protein
MEVCVVNGTHRQLYPWERRGTHCAGGWVVSRADLDGCEKSLPPTIRFPDRPSRTICCIVEAILAYLM